MSNKNNRVVLVTCGMAAWARVSRPRWLMQVKSWP